MILNSFSALSYFLMEQLLNGYARKFLFCSCSCRNTFFCSNQSCCSKMFNSKTKSTVQLLCLSPIVTGEVYCFPRRPLIFSFGRRVIYHLKGLWEYIPKSIPSVCTTIFKRKAGFCVYMFDVIHQWIHLNELYKLMERFFFKFRILFRTFGQKTKKKIQKDREA